MTALTPWIDTPEAVELDLIEEIKSAILDHPRSLQKTIGPSEVGMPCTRRLLHKLNGDDEPQRGLPWLPTIGTAMHTWLAGVMENAIGQHYDPPRYLIEHKVMVGDIAGVPCWGSSDLFDSGSGTVIDWKIIGKGPMQEYRRKGPREQYRKQAHLYGRGFALQGYTVNQVMLAFLPRNEIDLSYRYFWAEPYDESVALAALERASGLAHLLSAIGIDEAVALYGPCDDLRYCPYCRDPNYTPYTPVASRQPADSARSILGSLKGVVA